MRFAFPAFFPHFFWFTSSLLIAVFLLLRIPVVRVALSVPRICAPSVPDAHPKRRNERHTPHLRRNSHGQALVGISWLADGLSEAFPFRTLIFAGSSPSFNIHASGAVSVPVCDPPLPTSRLLATLSLESFVRGVLVHKSGMCTLIC